MPRAGASANCGGLQRFVPPIAYFAVFFQTVFLVVLAATDGYDKARTGEWLRLVLTFTTTVAVFVLAHLVAPRGRRGGPAVVLVFWALFVIVAFARYETAGSFDYGFAHENVRELMTPLGRQIVGSQVKPHEIVLLLVLPLAAGAFVLFRWRGKRTDVPRERALGIAVALVAIVLPPLFRVRTHESMTAFGASAVRFFADKGTLTEASGPRYPFVHEFKPSAAAKAIANGATRPDVILLFLESWSGIYTDAKRPDGKAVMPVFDAKRREGLTFDRFYGNSIQSSRGRFATMCSLIPMYRGKEFKDLHGAPLHCLPHVLAEAGYTTLIDSGSDEPAFERSDVFFKQLGFGDVRFEDPKLRGRNPSIWGVGLQDDVFYRAFFERLDARAQAAPGTPLFAAAINVSHHYPFNHDPSHKPADGYATKYARNYIASIGAQDAWLTTFFEELDKRPRFRDAIVVLVGDHSFPADEHGIHFNGLGAYEESFRTSLAIRWRGHVVPQVVTDRTVSQLDLAPTIADLLQIEHKSHFVGHSLVDGDLTHRAAPMVQPYDGIRLVAVKYPFKLERHESAEQEHLFDLSRDPNEENDRIDDPSLAKEAAELRQTITQIRTSQSILSARRIWPPDGAPNPP